MLQVQIPDVVRAVHRQLKEKSIKTRQGCFSLLTELVLVMPGALDQHLSSLMPGIQYSLGDKNTSSNMKIDTLAFLSTLLSNHNHQVFHPHIKALVPVSVDSSSSLFLFFSFFFLASVPLLRIVFPRLRNNGDLSKLALYRVQLGFSWFGFSITRG